MIFADDHDLEHAPVADNCVSWCDEFYFRTNVPKTKDMAIDLKDYLQDHPGDRVIFGHEDIDLVRVTDNKLCFEMNTNAVCKKVPQC